MSREQALSLRREVMCRSKQQPTQGFLRRRSTTRTAFAFLPCSLRCGGSDRSSVSLIASSSLGGGRRALFAGNSGRGTRGADGGDVASDSQIRKLEQKHVPSSLARDPRRFPSSDSDLVPKCNSNVSLRLLASSPAVPFLLLTLLALRSLTRRLLLPLMIPSPDRRPATPARRLQEIACPPTQASTPSLFSTPTIYL